MLDLRIISKKGSNAASEIANGAGIPKYRGNKYHKVQGIVNYGLAGARFTQFLQVYKSARDLPILNRNIGMSKYSALTRVSKGGILIPDSSLTLPVKGKKGQDKWLVKKMQSIGGKGIKFADSSVRQPDRYFQKYIENRRYELRVHIFKWSDEAKVQKRLGDKDTIAWNFSSGGHFQTVHNTGAKIFQDAIKISKEVLDIMGMSFGAVDFVVDDAGKIYFLEINSAPGFTELSKGIYLNAFARLKEMSYKEFGKLC